MSKENLDWINKEPLHNDQEIKYGLNSIIKTGQECSICNMKLDKLKQFICMFCDPCKSFCEQCGGVSAL